MSPDALAGGCSANLVTAAMSEQVVDKVAHGQTRTLNLEGAAAMIALALSKSALDALGTALMTCNALE